MYMDLRFGFLRLSTVKKCPHMLISDHRELRNSSVKLMWAVVGGGQLLLQLELELCKSVSIVSDLEVI